MGIWQYQVHRKRRTSFHLPFHLLAGRNHNEYMALACTSFWKTVFLLLSTRVPHFLHRDHLERHWLGRLVLYQFRVCRKVSSDVLLASHNSQKMLRIGFRFPFKHTDRAILRPKIGPTLPTRAIKSAVDTNIHCLSLCNIRHDWNLDQEIVETDREMAIHC